MPKTEVIWVHHAKLKSSVVLVHPELTIDLNHSSEHKIIKFEPPKQITDDERWEGWETSLRSTWVYSVSIEYKAWVLEDGSAEDAKIKAHRNLDNLASLMSFLASSPVKVDDYGSTRTPPGEEIAGGTYRLITLDAQLGFTEQQIAVIDETSLRNDLTRLLMSDALSKPGGDRISRSLRWLQRSYEATTPVDDFLCLMLSLEGISLIGEKMSKGKEKIYWVCNRCKAEYQNCPNCKASTGRVASGSALIRRFLEQKVGWTGKQWNDLWAIRSKIAHGSQDLTKYDQIKLANTLSQLEIATIAALKFVLEIPNESEPKNVRQRSQFTDASLDITFTRPEEEVREE